MGTVTDENAIFMLATAINRLCDLAEDSKAGNIMGVADIAKLLAISESTVRRMFDDGELTNISTTRNRKAKRSQVMGIKKGRPRANV